MSACKNVKTTQETGKKVRISLDQGEVFVSFITNRKPNTDSLFQSYLGTVFPVAQKHGAVPLANLLPDKVVAGAFAATDFIGLTKWPNQAAAAAFSNEMPEEKLDSLRRPIWNNLKVFAIPITKSMSFSIQEGKLYEYKLFWGTEKEINDQLNHTRKHQGVILFDSKVVMYKELQNGKSPDKIVLVEWQSADQANRTRSTQSKTIREEAFYAHFKMPQTK